MKSTTMLLGSLWISTWIYAQTPILPGKADSLTTLSPPVQIDGLHCYFEGMHIHNISGPVDYIIMPAVRMEGTTTIQRNQLMSLPVRNVNAIVGIVAGVDSRAGQIPNIRGARQDGTAYYIDGVRMRGLDLPEEKIK